MVSQQTYTYYALLPDLSVLTFLGCAGMAAFYLFLRDRARIAYIWLSLPGTLLAAIAIGQFVYVAYSMPNVIANPIVFLIILIYATFNPGWIIFPTVLVRNATSKSSIPLSGFSLLMCCLLMVLWVWGFWIDNSVWPRMMDALA
jgi:hypothetical protein